MTPTNNSPTLFDIDPEEVLEEARQKGLQVKSIEDFREVEEYEIIENLMDQYIERYARYSAIVGSTSGIGGLVVFVTFGGVEVLSTAIQLYRLSQRLALLNGFDPGDPLQRDKVLKVYLQALGFKTAIQTILKLTLLGLKVYKGKEKESKLMEVLQRLSGQSKKSERDTDTLSIVGAAVGAYTSYAYAYDTGKSMREAYKEYYHLEWK